MKPSLSKLEASLPLVLLLPIGVAVGLGWKTSGLELAWSMIASICGAAPR